MANLASSVATDFGRYYQSRAEKLHALLAPLSDQQIWSRPYPYGNSIGHLLLHLTGNLNYYVGAQIASTGYQRNRDLEFADRGQKRKADLLEAFDRALAMVQDTLARQSAADWLAAYTAHGMEDAGDRFTAFLRCAAHIDHHLGQMMYLVKEIQRTSLLNL
jgi:uncharacterized damage-inducible protein DinB